MKILNLSTYDLQGGAARAAYRLHQGLKSIELDSWMMVQTQTSDDPTVISPQGDIQKNWVKLRPGLSKIPILKYRQRQRKIFSPQWLPDRLLQSVQSIAPDVINLNWVCDGFMQIETLAKLSNRLHLPIVWTLMDEWSFTGGCHYTGQGLDVPMCDRYQNSCGNCPALNSQRKHDLSYQIWKRKQKIYTQLQMSIVSPSKWLTEQARQSSLFKDFSIQTIPYGLDTQCYRPRDPKVLRDILDLPQDKLLVAFGAFNATRDPRKGWNLLQQALVNLKQAGWHDRIHLVVFGASQGPDITGFPTHFLGQVADDRLLALIYGAVDVMVVPSIQEAFGQTASEAIACGIPIVAFSNTGVADIVDHKFNGYLAQPFDTDDLVRGIRWVLTTDQPLGQRARQVAEQRFSLTTQAYAYRDLFESLLADRHHHQ